MEDLTKSAELIEQEIPKLIKDRRVYKNGQPSSFDRNNNVTKNRNQNPVVKNDPRISRQ